MVTPMLTPARHWAVSFSRFGSQAFPVRTLNVATANMGNTMAPAGKWLSLPKMPLTAAIASVTRKFFPVRADARFSGGQPMDSGAYFLHSCTFTWGRMRMAMR